MSQFLQSKQKLPLESDFAMSLAFHSVLSEACRILDDPASDTVDKILAQQTIKTILEALQLPEQ